MKKIMLVEIISILYIILFTYAALTKILDYQAFEVQLGQSPLLLPFAKWLAWIVPVIEIVISILLSISLVWVIDPLHLISLFLSFGLMTLFTIYIIILMNYSYYVPCSCGGILQHMSWKIHLLFNTLFVLLAAAAILIFQSKRPKIFYCNKTVASEKL